MAAKPSIVPSPSVIPLFGPRIADDEVEIAVGLPTALPIASRAQVWGVTAVPDLSALAKVWLVIGAGRSGKTTLIRYAMELIAAKGASALAAALDPTNRSLAGFIDGVAQPPTNDAAAVARWLESLLRAMMEDVQSALLDLGGGDTSLGRVLADVPDLAAVMEASGVAPVAAYCLGPRVDDLSSLAAFEAQGFRPRATLLVLNEGLGDPTVAREDAFARVIRHSVFKAAVARGAIPIWMPRLDASVAAEIEAKRLHFTAARDGAGRAPLGVFDRSRVRAWMTAFDAALEPIQSWLP